MCERSGDVSDGIDRLYGEEPTRSRLGPSSGPMHQSMPTVRWMRVPRTRSISPITSSCRLSSCAESGEQCVIPGISAWRCPGSQSSRKKQGKVFFWEPAYRSVSDHLEQLRRIPPYQIYAVFQAVPHRKPSFQSINVQTELAEGSQAPQRKAHVLRIPTSRHIGDLSNLPWLQAII
jgi:hypothetical protein